MVIIYCFIFCWVYDVKISLIPVGLQNLRCQEDLQVCGAAPWTDCFGPHRIWQTIVTSVHDPPSLCSWSSHLLGSVGAISTVDLQESLSVLQESDSGKVEWREHSSWHVEKGRHFCGQAMVHRGEEFWASLCVWVGEWAFVLVSHCLFKNRGTVYRSLLTYVLTSSWDRNSFLHSSMFHGDLWSAIFH